MSAGYHAIIFLYIFLYNYLVNHKWKLRFILDLVHILSTKVSVSILIFSSKK